MSDLERQLDFAKESVRYAYDDAIVGWAQVLDIHAKTNGDPEAANSLEESLVERFGVTEDEAWMISSRALKDIRDIRRR